MSFLSFHRRSHPGTRGARHARRLCLIVLLVATVPAWAQKICRYNGWIVEPATFQFSPPATITLTGNEAVGSVLWEEQRAPRMFNTAFCDGGSTGVSGLVNTAGTPGQVIGTRNVMPTGIPGIGFVFIERVRYPNGIRSYPDSPDGGVITASSSFWLSFVRTADPLSTIDRYVGAQTLASWRVGDNRLELARINISAVQFRMPGRKTCVITAPSQVDLGRTSMGALRAVGTTTAVVPFNIGFECTGMRARLFATMNDASDPSNRSNRLSLSPTASGPASGVAVQLRNGANNALISYGPASNVAGAQNQFFLFDTNISQVYSAPFQANIIQTAERVTPGTVAARAVMTVSYQ